MATFSTKIGRSATGQNGSEFNFWDMSTIIDLDDMTTAGTAANVADGASAWSAPDDGATWIAKVSVTGGAVYVHHGSSVAATSANGFKMADGDELTVVLKPGYTISVINQ